MGVCEHKAGNIGKAIKHYMIAAGFGHTVSLNNVKVVFKNGGHATRDDYHRALRAYQQYLEEVRSDQRDKAAAFFDQYEYLFKAGSSTKLHYCPEFVSALCSTDII